MDITMKIDHIIINATFNNSTTAQSIINKLPIKSNVKLWGEEIYFEIPVACKPENPTLDVTVGDIAYWPDGACMCLFFGRTPISTDNKPKPASSVTIIGKMKGDISILSTISEGTSVSILKGE